MKEHDGDARSALAEQLTKNLISEMGRLRAEVVRLRAEVSALRRSEEASSQGHRSNAKSIRGQAEVLRQHARVLQRHGRRLDGLRLDRQIGALPRWLRKRARRRRAPQSRFPSPADDSSPPAAGPSALDRPSLSSGASAKRHLVIVAHAYPYSDTVYGGQPIERRARFYREAGFAVTVVLPLARQHHIDTIAQYGVRVLTAAESKLHSRLASLKPSQLLIHSPTPELWAPIAEAVDDLPTHVWIHGFEARDWKELSFDFTANELLIRRQWLDDINQSRRELLSELFARPSISKIFVSEYMRTTAERFAETLSSNGRVVHNIIDPDLFPYSPKDRSMATRVLMIRSFDRRNYGTDLGCLAIKAMRKSRAYKKIEFDIVGDGRYFEEDTAELLDDKNVTVHRGVLNASGIRQRLDSNGIALLPTRWDSQGMMMGESMMAGLVPVTNAVSAIPEFVNDRCARLASAEDFKGIASALLELVEDDGIFEELSAAAHKRVANQCGPEQTVRREISLLEQFE